MKRLTPILLSLVMFSSASSFAQGKKATKPKPPKDAAAAEKLCEGGDLDACIFAAEWYTVGGKGVAEDKDRAQELGAKACDGGKSEGCYWAGYAAGNSWSKAGPFFEKGCEANHARSCYSLGMDVHGEYGDRDKEKQKFYLKKALELFQSECKAGNKDACLGEAEMYYNAYHLKVNHIIPADEEKAVKIFKTLCDKKNGRACTLLGDAYETATSGMPQDDKKAKAFYDKGCKLGAQEGCDALKALLEDRRSKGIRL